MAWETRNGRGRYYTRSVRINGEVQREYIGIGPAAEILAELDVLERMEREDRARLLQNKQAQVKELDKKVADVSQLADILARACLLASGFHNHRGEWRRRRVQPDQVPGADRG